MATRKRAPSFKLEIPGDTSVKETIRDKMNCVRDKISNSCNMQTSVTHADILNTVLDYWLDNQNGNRVPHVSQAQDTKKSDTEEELFITAKTSIKELIALTEDHARFCSCQLQVKKTTYAGHVLM